MSDEAGGGAEGGLSKAELRKLHKAAKKEEKQTKVVKAKERAETEPPAAKEPKEKAQKQPKPPKAEPSKPAEEKKPAPEKQSDASKSEQPSKAKEPSPANSEAVVAKVPLSKQDSNSSSRTIIPSATPAEPVKPIVTMFQSDFPEDWTSGAVPLLAALWRLIRTISQMQDEHDCSLAVAAMKSKDRGSSGAEEALLRHIDEAHIRPFLASKLGLVPGNGCNGHSTAPSNAPRKSLLCVGHLAVIKWVRELLLSQRIDAGSSPLDFESTGNLTASSSQQQLSQRQSTATVGVMDLLSSLSESLVDIFVERIQLAADGICRFGSEVLASCTSSRPISPAYQFSALQSQLSFPSSLVITLASCTCNATIANPCSAKNQPPAISQLISRALAMTAKKCDEQRRAIREQAKQNDDGSEDDSADGESEEGDGDSDEGNHFAPPNLTVAVAMPGCCDSSATVHFNEGELGESNSMIVFPTPLCRLGSAIAEGQVSAVLLPADAVLANRGSAVLAPRGAGMLALAARTQWHCPVIVLAETYKIIAGGQDEIEETLKGLAPTQSSKSPKAITELHVDDADLISADYISVVVTELGAVPAAALPSILRLSQKARPSRGGAAGKGLGDSGQKKGTGRKESEQFESIETKTP